MPASVQKPPTVFISYAHQSEALASSVATLADWLGSNGCQVLTDHVYVHRPPEQGWQVWMSDCIRAADTVLVVCSPGLKARYEKTAAPSVGRGATYEGAIVTQHIYDGAMRNTKFFPVLPDGGSLDDLPHFLKPWWNGHFFPSGNGGILRMVLGEVPRSDLPSEAGGGTDGDDPLPWPILDEHARMAIAKLKAAPERYMQGLKKALAEVSEARPVPDSAETMVRWLSVCPVGEDEILDLFLAVRQALDAVPATGTDGDARRRAEEAASALFFLAACRMVNKAAHQAASSRTDPHVLAVPRSEGILCGVIATALFGGELHLIPSEQADFPVPEYLFDLDVPAGADERVFDFERAAFAAICSGNRKATSLALDTGPLDEDERDLLTSRIRTIKKRHRRSMALVVRGITPAQAAGSLPVSHQVPVMLPDTAATEELLGMRAGTLLAEIREFWSELHQLRNPEPETPPRRPASEPTGAAPMSSSKIELNITGNGQSISIAGDHSASQSGKGHTAQLEHRKGIEHSALLPALQEIAAAIAELRSATACEALGAEARSAEVEAAKGADADPGVVRRALDAIKSGAKALEEGGKIAQLCDKALDTLASLFG